MWSDRFVSSGFRLCSSANLVLGVMVEGKSVEFVILMDGLSVADVIAGTFGAFVELRKRLYCPSYWVNVFGNS